MKQETVNEIVEDTLELTPILQDCPVDSALLRPADLRYCYWYMKWDELKGREVLALGLYYEKFAELCDDFELKKVKDTVDNWMFESPVLLDGNMSLCTDGELEPLTLPSGDYDPDSVNFIYGHHEFNDIELSSNIPVSVFTDETAGIFYRKVISIMEDLGEIESTDYKESESEEEMTPEQKSEVLEKVSKATTRKEQIQAMRQLAEDAKLSPEEMEERKLLGGAKRTARQMEKLVSAMESAFIAGGLNIDAETMARIEFSNIVNSEAEPYDIESFLGRFSVKPEKRAEVERYNKILKRIKDRPLVKFITDSDCQFDLFYIKDVRALKSSLGLPRDLSKSTTRDAEFAKRPESWLFIPRYAQVLNIETMKMEWQIVEFQVRDLDSDTSETGIKYRVWYPYNKIRTKRSELFKRYDSLRPIMVYAGKEAWNEFDLKYTQSNMLALNEGELRWEGRTMVEEGEINAMTTALLNPRAIVISTGTSKIVPEVHNSIMNNISQTVSIGVMFDDTAKTFVGAQVLRLGLDDSPDKSNPGVCKYEAVEQNMPDNYIEAGLDYENLIQSSIAEMTPERAQHFFVEVLGMNLTYNQIVHWRDQMKALNLPKPNGEFIADPEVETRFLPKLKMTQLSLQDQIQRQIKELIEGCAATNKTFVDDIEVSKIRSQETLVQKKIKMLELEIFEMTESYTSSVSEKARAAASVSGEKVEISEKEEFEEDKETISMPRLIYFLTKEDVEKNPDLLPYYEDDAPRFRSIIRKNELEWEEIKELKVKEAAFFEARAELQELLVKRLQKAYGFNPSQEIVGEMGLSLDPSKDHKGAQHIALAQGASGGKTTGLMEAVIRYYGEICQETEDLNLQDFRKALKRLIEHEQVILSVKAPLLKLLKLSSDNLNSRKKVGKFYAELRKLPEDLQERVKNLEDTIKLRIRQLRGGADIKIGLDGKTLDQFLFEQDPGNGMTKFLRTLPNAYADYEEVLDKLKSAGDDVTHLEALWDFVSDAMQLLPEDARKLMTHKDGDRRLYRSLPPIKLLGGFLELWDKFTDICGRFHIEVEDYEKELYLEAKKLFERVSSRGMVIASQSISEVDHYYFVFRHVHGIDPDFVRRFHSSCEAGSHLGADDEQMVNTPLVLVTHKRLERPTDCLGYRDILGTYRKRSIVVIDEAFNSGRTVSMDVENLRRIDQNLLEGMFTIFHSSMEELEETRKDAKAKVEWWLNSGDVFKIPEARNILHALISMHYPNLKLHKLDDKALNSFFNEMSEVMRSAIYETVDILLVGLHSWYRKFLRDDIEDLEERFEKLKDIEDLEEDDKAEAEMLAEQLMLFTSIQKYFDNCAEGIVEENPTKSLSFEEIGIVYNWWVTEAEVGDHSRYLQLFNPVSRQLHDVSVLVLDATAYLVLTSPEAEGASQEIIDELDAIYLEFSETEDTDKKLSLVQEQRDILTKGLKNHYLTKATFERLQRRTIESAISRTDFEGVNVRPTRDPLIESELFAPHIYNGGWLGHTPDDRNPYDMEWSTVQMAGPPIALRSWESAHLPIGRVSAQYKRTLKLSKSDEVIVNASLLNADLISELIQLVEGPYPKDLLINSFKRNPEMLDIFLKLALIDRLHAEVLKYVDGTKDVESVIILPRDWKSIQVEILEPDMEKSGVSIDLEMEKNVNYDQGEVVSTRFESWEYNSASVQFGVSDFDSFISQKFTWKCVKLKTNKAALEHLKNLTTELAESSRAIQYNFRILVACASLDIISQKIADYLLGEDYVISRRIDHSGTEVCETHPRAINVFCWRKLNYSVQAVLSSATMEYFPLFNDIIDSLSEKSFYRELLTDVMDASKASELSETLEDVKGRVKDRVANAIDDCDYISTIYSEMKPLPFLLRKRVEACIEAAPESERQKLLKEKLDDHLLISHHGSSDCKATSSFQHATGTMIIGDHMIPQSVIEDSKVDCGLTLTNKNQADALTIQELYRSILRTGTVHMPMPIDLLTINHAEARFQELILEHNRGRMPHTHWSRTMLGRIVTRFSDRMKSSKVTGKLVPTIGSEQNMTTSHASKHKSTMFLCLMYPQILDIASESIKSENELVNSKVAPLVRNGRVDVPISLNHLEEDQLNMVLRFIKESEDDMKELGVRLNSEFSLEGGYLTQFCTSNLRQSRIESLELFFALIKQPLIEYLEGKNTSDLREYFGDDWLLLKRKNLLPALEILDSVN
ncbi:hypothetical protein [Vibrio phage Va2]|nr:hypothetical protein [Vibrio phage Va2]